MQALLSECLNTGRHTGAYEPDSVIIRLIPLWQSDCLQMQCKWNQDTQAKVKTIMGLHELQIDQASSIVPFGVEEFLQDPGMLPSR